MTKPSITLACLCLITIGSAQLTHAGEFHPVAFIAYDKGGDTLIETEIISINNRPISIKGDIKAGTGFTMAIGAYAPISEMFGIQGTVGTKTDSLSFIDGNVAFTRTPIDLIAFMHFDDKNSLGLGGTYHTNSTFSYNNKSNPSQAFNFDFKDAFGAIGEYNYAMFESNEGGLKLGLRYTKIKYDLSDGSESFDGTSIGIVLYLY